jgi:hypothetical protein
MDDYGVNQALGSFSKDVHNDHCDLFSLWTSSSWVLYTSVGSKLFVTLGFVLSLHFVQ